MSFFGFAFPADLQSFTTHGQVLDYLCSYADEYDLHPMISLGCSVETVRRVAVPSKPEEGQGTTTAGAGAEQERAVGKWEVVYRRNDKVGAGSGAGAEADGGDARTAAAAASPVTELFDAVCVCNGHFDRPFTPWAEGLDGFRGTSMHARQYDRPGVEAFVGKRVLCVGSRSSGTDVAREVSSVGEFRFLFCPFGESESRSDPNGCLCSSNLVFGFVIFFAGERGKRLVCRPLCVFVGSGRPFAAAGTLLWTRQQCFDFLSILVVRASYIVALPSSPSLGFCC